LSAVLGLAFLPIYYVLPPVDVSIREVLPGVAVAAAGWVTLQLRFRFYAGNASSYAAYRMIGAMFLFVTCLYFDSVVILLRGGVNAALRRAKLRSG
jgi:membrane protein